MRTEEAVTEAEGIWFAFAGVCSSTRRWGRPRSSSCAAMSRRWREEGEAGEAETPYGPPAVEAP